MTAPDLDERAAFSAAVAGRGHGASGVDSDRVRAVERGLAGSFSGFEVGLALWSRSGLFGWHM
jgi:hypothetical protein